MAENELRRFCERQAFRMAFVKTAANGVKCRWMLIYDVEFFLADFGFVSVKCVNKKGIRGRNL